MKNLLKFAEESKWELVGNPVEEKGTLKADKELECIALADEMANKLLAQQ
ncbi:MAG: hypothetical protein ACK5IJ_10400 [Mangrovibacterium sp.]